MLGEIGHRLDPQCHDELLDLARDPWSAWVRADPAQRQAARWPATCCFRIYLRQLTGLLPEACPPC